MSNAQETIALLEESLRTRRDLLGRTRTGVARDALARLRGVKLPSGDGTTAIALMFVGETPEEESSANELLDKIIRAMGIAPDDASIVPIPKSPGGASAARETQNFLPQLHEQIARTPPRVLVALGETAMSVLAGVNAPLETMRGHWFEFEGIPLLPTQHPSHLLRNGSNTEKRKVWEDMLLVMEKLGLPISEKQRGYFLSPQ